MKEEQKTPIIVEENITSLLPSQEYLLTMSIAGAGVLQDFLSYSCLFNSILYLRAWVKNSEEILKINFKENYNNVVKKIDKVQQLIGICSSYYVGLRDGEILREDIKNERFIKYQEARALLPALLIDCFRVFDILLRHTNLIYKGISPRYLSMIKNNEIRLTRVLEKEIGRETQREGEEHLEEGDVER